MEVYNDTLKYETSAVEPKPWGFEIPITFYHTSGEEYKFIMAFPAEPVDEEIQEMVSLCAGKTLAKQLKRELCLQQK